MTTLAVVSAGLSEPSSSRMLADRLAAAAQAALRRQGRDAGIEVIELRDLAHDVTDNLLTGFPPARLRGAIETVTGADGLVAVTPIFNASYSGLFKSFFDVLETGALAGKPVVIGATGGTARHSLALDHALRPMFAYLRSVVVPTAVYAASADWGTGGGDPLTERIALAAEELAALVGGRALTTPPSDPYDTPTPFEDLLNA